MCACSLLIHGGEVIAPDATERSSARGLGIKCCGYFGDRDVRLAVPEMVELIDGDGGNGSNCLD